MSETRPIASITIGPRFRRDFGDIETLAASIAEDGLIQPIAVTPDGLLLAGHRRLLACKLLGWQAIPVSIMEERNAGP